jgi:hypothetical protein
MFNLLILLMLEYLKTFCKAAFYPFRREETKHCVGKSG